MAEMFQKINLLDRDSLMDIKPEDGTTLTAEAVEDLEKSKKRGKEKTKNRKEKDEPKSSSDLGHQAVDGPDESKEQVLE